MDKFNATINDLVENEVGVRVNDFMDDLKHKGKTITALEKKCNILRKENEELKQLLSVFKGLVNEKNFSTILAVFDLSIDFDVNVNRGMHCESVPMWFKWLVKYYQDRDRLFMLMDLFDIEYLDIARSIKMPYDYDEEELDLLFDRLSKMYVCNGCIFKENIGFWYSVLRKCDFVFDHLFSGSGYTQIPWQLFLRNNLLVMDKYFKKIISAIKGNEAHSLYFFMLPKYQELTEEQFEEMAHYLPECSSRGFHDVHRDFIELDKNIIKRNQSLSSKYKDRIIDSSQSSFHYLNYPIEMQIEFIKNCDNYCRQLELVKQMDVSLPEKLDIIKECVKMKLTEEEGVCNT